MSVENFTTFRLKAQSFDDIRAWIFEHAQCNDAGVIQYSALDECKLELKTLGYRNDEHNVTNNWAQAYFKLTLPKHKSYSGAIPAIPGVRITDVEPDMASPNVLKVNVQLPTGDWPFVAAALLFKLRETKSEKEAMLAPHLLNQCFSELPVETYLNLIDNELVPHEETAFKEWLMRAGVKHTQGEVAFDLPDCGL